MNASDFYRNYGRNIFQLQNDPRCHTLPYWPFANPDNLRTDIPIDRPEIKSKFKCKGFAYPGYLSAVIYEFGYITYMKLPSRYCGAISYEFSGCFMAKLCFKGEWYIFHIATSREIAGDCKIQWLDFLHFHKNDITGITMFKPTLEAVYKNWITLRSRCLPVTLACLIDDRNKGYSFVFDYHDCKVAESDDMNIERSHTVLLARDEDKLDFLRKTI